MSVTAALSTRLAMLERRFEDMLKRVLMLEARLRVAEEEIRRLRGQ